MGEIVGLVVRGGGRSWQVAPGRAWTVGRSGESDIQLDNPRISRVHAVLEHTESGWVLSNRSSNGMYVQGARVEQVLIDEEPVTVVLGSVTSGQEIDLAPDAGQPVSIGEATTMVGQFPPLPLPLSSPSPPESLAKTTEIPLPPLSTASGQTASGQTASGQTAPWESTSGQTAPGQTASVRTPTAVHAIDQATVSIGRAPENTVVLHDLLVSRRHAHLRRSSAGWELIDNHSANGTYVNGTRITRALIGPDDIVGIGHQLLHLSDDRLVEYIDTGDISYEAAHLHVETANGTVLLDDVSFVLPQRSLLAVVGPSGAGKSTLLGALTGFRPATTGTVRYDDRDLYDNYPELRHRIGFVPQDDILHTPLTVRRALNYAARLRFPQDVTATERQHRIDEVLTELGLAAHADQRIDSLSGGQRKRTSVALELLTKPSLLFLDEPTSGLDPGYEKSVMQTLRTLADDGRSVVVVTHNIAHLNMCDRLLVLAPGGRLAYFGPPQQALAYFGCTDFADLFILLENDTDTDWTTRYTNSPLHTAFTPTEHPPTPIPTPTPAPTKPKPKAQQSPAAQFAILARRYLAVIAADRQYTLFLLALPLLLSLFTYAVPGDAGLSLANAITQQSKQPTQLLVLLIIGGALMGCAGSIREIVKEQAIYRREHGIGLSGGAYLASKLVVLGAISALQGLILGFLGVAFLPPPDDSLLLQSGSAEMLRHVGSAEIAAAVVAVTVVSMILGLLISALISNADRGMPLLVVVVMAQLVLCGGMFAVNDRIPLEQLAWLSPSRWAYAMAGSSLGVNYIRLTDPDPMWTHDRAHWLTALGMCAALGVVMVILLAARLHGLDRHRRARKRPRPFA
ncbi:FHA domain-containing protein [Mycobacterium paragordonae]|uniref:ATP-binding cassette domain-containing protein n=1 Tax=Mycobacterium paragordonae TaxID=1389713 RepID=A0A4R5W8F0_9MYCO|nr:FHA domain-containing protein [Mycobacterium paragordonae]MDP7733382.1 ATP-binding cassette domain-containing protein [Mycobacterium paragordonae]TDK85200.1 ATP-binding cassette domain-containing protein [Mycobacterium paragordonae]TDK97847.1 ATP-binding cassette domain-containing protein [Mycobacterium paragordonae]